MANILVRIPNFFLDDENDLNFYVVDELEPERYIISFQKNETMTDDNPLEKSIFYKFSNKKIKNGIIRYLIFMDILRPLCGYYEHNYDYIYENNENDFDHLYQLQSIYMNKFFFFGSSLKLQKIIDDIMFYLPYCAHYSRHMDDYSYINTKYSYYMIQKKCITCIKNKNVKSVYNVNKYLCFIYDIFYNKFNCPYEITEKILDYIKPIDLVCSELSIFM